MGLMSDSAREPSGEEVKSDGAGDKLEITTMSLLLATGLTRLSAESSLPAFPRWAPVPTAPAVETYGNALMYPSM